MVIAVLAFGAGPSPASAQSCPSPVFVKAGDTLSKIARRCGVSVDSLKAVNPRLRADPNALYVGMAIRMPDGYAAGPPEAPPPVAEAAPPRRDRDRSRPEIAVDSYVVRPGDTLASIARIHRVSLPELILLNPGINPIFLRVGQVVYVPGGMVVEPADPSFDLAASVTPDRGPVGTIVEVEARGFPPNVRLRLLAGTSARTLREIERVTTNRRGRAVVNVRIPDWAADERRIVFRFETLDGRLRTDNDRFRVAAGGDPDREQVRVTGTLTREGAECQAMRGDDGRLYTLQGEFVGFRAGDRVEVRGRIADVSTCMQGITIDVRRIEDAG
jgi:LysM repeat protein